MNNRFDYKDIAANYDNLIKQYNCPAPEIIFDALSDFLKAGTKLLDLGIGTGASSQLFYNECIEIYGLDNSAEMLEVCRSKRISRNLMLCDLLNEEIPFTNVSFDYIICSGVLHFFSDPALIFTKADGVLKKRGFFAFTIMENTENESCFYKEMASGTSVYYHNMIYINSLMKKMNYTEMKNIDFMTLKDLETKEQQKIKLLMMRKE